MVVRPGRLNVRFFADAAAFRAWLERNHAVESELQVGFHKVDSGRAGITWAQSVDEALCFGWIDGMRHRIDDAAYAIRFTPRKPGSIWSAVNIDRVAALIGEGRMQPAGLAAFARRSDTRSAVYAYEQRNACVLSPTDESRFRADAGAWQWFQTQADWYRKQAIWRVVSAKREETRQKRLAALIEAAAQGRRW